MMSLFGHHALFTLFIILSLIFESKPYQEAYARTGSSYDQADVSIALTADGNFFVSTSEFTGSYYSIRIYKFQYDGVNLAVQGSSSCSSNNVYAYSISRSHDGGAICAGRRPAGCTGSYVAFIVKFSNVLANVWEKEIPEANCLTGIDIIDGFYLLSGYKTGDFGAGFFLFDDGSIFVTKYIASDIAAPNYLNAAFRDYPRFYFVGSAEIATFGFQCTLTILNNGFFRTSLLYYGGAGTEKCHSFVKNEVNHLFLVGNTNSFGSEDGYVVKTDYDGNIIWEKTYGGAGTDRLRDIVILPDYTFVAGGISNTNRPNIDFWLINIDKDGNLLDEKFDGSSAYYDDAFNSLIFIEGRLIAFSGTYPFSDTDPDIYWQALKFKCLPGYYCTDNIHCLKCPLGQYQSSYGQAFCIDCPIGKYADQLGTANCKDCPVGYYCPSLKTINPVPCVAGTFTNVLQTSVCSKCPLGQYTAIEGQSKCDLCLPGTYQDEMGKISCKSCPAGYFQDESGKNSCKKCPLGKYQSDTGKTSCLDCNPGSYQNEEGKIDCVLCEPGKYQPDPGSSSCKLCDVMKYQDESGKISCKNCDPGFYQDAMGQAKCLSIFRNFTT